MAQEKSPFILEGKLLDATSKSPIPFAKIVNKTFRTSTISNETGYFKLEVSGANDEIIVSQIGYTTQNVMYDVSIPFQLVYLEAHIQLIQEMIAMPRDISYLCHLIQKCRLSAGTEKNNGKAYYELKTYIDSSQIELIEGFYNYASVGYDVRQLDLKAGRLAIQPENGKMFMSFESSKAISQMKLFQHNDYFPMGPFEMKAREIQKKYYLNLTNKYVLDNRDSVYVIEYRPKDTTGAFFTGTIWLNKSRFQILKVTTNCTDCANYPFVPIFPVDKILKLDLHITKTFQENKGKMCFNHVDFQYNLDYKSIRRDSTFFYHQPITDSTPDSLLEIFQIKTNAVLYSCDFHSQFNLPKFKFGENVSDYRKINGLPYDSFFWENNTENRVNAQKKSNQLFFTDSSSVRDKELFNFYFYGKHKLAFIYWYREWSNNRIRFRNVSETEMEPDLNPSAAKPMAPILNVDKYDLVVQLFADRSTYNDSTHVITATIFDPFESYYNLPMDMATHCFINMYFDLHEIARRELQQALEKDLEHFDEIYNQFMKKFEKTKRQFLNDVERGTKEEKMITWNHFICAQLGIDNLDLFNPFPKE